jgi:hypothetical protein
MHLFICALSPSVLGVEVVHWQRAFVDSCHDKTFRCFRRADYEELGAPVSRCSRHEEASEPVFGHLEPFRSFRCNVAALPIANNESGHTQYQSKITDRKAIVPIWTDVEEKGELVAIGSAPRRNAEIVEPLLHYLTGFLHFALGR